MKPLTSRLSNERIEELLGFVKSGDLVHEKIQSYVNNQTRLAVIGHISKTEWTRIAAAHFGYRFSQDGIFAPNSGPDKATYPWFPVAEGFEDLAEAFDDFGIFIYKDSDPELIVDYRKNDPLSSTNS
jgi:hypothetical protein